MSWRGASLILVTALAAGCNWQISLPRAPIAGAAGYRGTIEWGCSPVDALAILLDLEPASGEPTPLISIALWPRQQLGSDVRIALDGARPEGAGSIFIEGTEWVPARRGEVVFEEYREAVRASGWFWLELDRGPSFEGRFEAEWLESGPVLCG